MDISLLEASRSGTADYEAVYDHMNSAISKVILSQTMTTDDGSSLSQATVHADVADAVKKGDADLLNGSFNGSVVRWLIDYNRSVLGDCTYPQVWRRVEPEEDINNRVERDKTLYDMGYRLTPEKVEEIYGEGYEYFERPQPMALTPAANAGPGESDASPARQAGTPIEQEAEPEFAAATPTADIFARRLQGQGLFAPMMDRLRTEFDRIKERGGTLQEFADYLDRAFPDLPSEELEAQLAQALTASRLAGIAEAEAEGE
jgi:phage gp29-like protein